MNGSFQHDADGLYTNRYQNIQAFIIIFIWKSMHGACEPFFRLVLIQSGKFTVHIQKQKVR